MRSKKVLLVALSLGLLFPSLKVNEALASDDNLMSEIDSSENTVVQRTNEDIGDVIDSINNIGNNASEKELEGQIQNSEYEAEEESKKEPDQKDEDKKQEQFEKKKEEALKEFFYLVSDYDSFQDIKKSIMKSKNLDQLEDAKYFHNSAIRLLTDKFPEVFFSREKVAVKDLINLSKLSLEEKQKLIEALNAAGNDNNKLKEIRKSIADYLPEIKPEDMTGNKPELLKPPVEEKKSKDRINNVTSIIIYNVKIADNDNKHNSINSLLIQDLIKSRNLALETVSTAKFLMKNYPNTVRNVKGNLEELIKVQEKLIIKADLLLKKYNMI